MTERDRLAALEAENERLAALLDSHGIQWRQPPSPQPGVREPESTNLSTDEKIALFRRLFRGRVDVYPVRWESKTSGKSGYAPACGNEWRPGICEKPRIKCGDCGHRLMLPVSDDVIFGQIPARYGGVLESARLDLGAIPVLAERLERSLLPFLRECRTADGQRILLLVEQHTRLARFDARLRQRHVGIVAKREPMLSASYLPSYKGSPEAVGG